jgi:methylmalonyl-CoA/ethylmalonyl-CoA epimerase
MLPSPHWLGIEHLGIAVLDLDAAELRYTALLGEGPYKREEVASEGVMASFFAVGGSKIELLAATRPDSPIATFIEKRGEGLHHVAYAVADLQAELDRLDAAGIALIHRHPKPGADNKIIAFLHPKATGGSLIELCQDVRTAY